MPRSAAASHSRSLALHILFICTGNICRSPIAERLTDLYARLIPVHNLSASSAGTNAVVGNPIHPYAAEVIEKFGGESFPFAARDHDPRMSSEADLVLTMTRLQRDLVLASTPRLLRRTFTLSEAAVLASKFTPRSVEELAVLRPHLQRREAVDIPDPIGRRPEFFAQVGRQIADLLPPLVELAWSMDRIDVAVNSRASVN